MDIARGKWAAVARRSARAYNSESIEKETSVSSNRAGSPLPVAVLKMMRLKGAKNMISNETKRQKAYDRLRKLTSDRIARALNLADEDLASLSLSQLINLLFLMYGDSGSTGNFSVSFAAAIELVGADMVWHEPETEKVAVAERVQ
jgi:hypothetical protein